MNCQGNMISSHDSSIMDEAIEILDISRARIASFLEALPGIICDPTIDKNNDKIRIGFKKVHCQIIELISIFVERIRDQEARIELLERKYGKTLYELEKVSTENKKLQEEIKGLTQQVSQQSDFYANYGAVSGTLLWRSSQFPAIVVDWMTRNETELRNFLSLSITTLNSFIDTFKNSFPPLERDECQFTLSMLGTIVNISSTPGGRKFVAEDSIGKQLIAGLVQYVPNLSNSGVPDKLKRLTLKILFNISMNCEGLIYLLDLKIEEVISQCIVVNDSEQPMRTLEMALLLMKSVTFDLKDARVVQRLLKNLPMDKIETLAMTCQEQDVCRVAQEILWNLKQCVSNADTLSYHSASDYGDDVKKPK